MVSLMIVLVSALVVISAHGCDDAGNACGNGQCPGCSYGSDFTGSCPCARFKGQANNKGCKTGDCASCNMYGCDCTVCNPGCSDICGTGSRHLMDSSRSLSQSSSVSPAQTNLSCSDMESFLADNIVATLKRTDKMWCADPDHETVGYLFLGYLFHLMDTNHDGKVQCTEYVNFRPNIKSLICGTASNAHYVPKVKPLCKIRAAILADAKAKKC